MSFWWLAVGGIASQGALGSDDGRLFLHLQTDRAVDLPWDRVVADQAWLDTLGLRAAAPELREGAEALRGAPVGESLQVALPEGTALLEVRPDARVATWLVGLDLGPTHPGELAPAQVPAEEPR